MTRIRTGILLTALGLLAVSTDARAGDVETWFGGQATTGAQFVQGTGVGTVLSQVEFDARVSSGPLYFRLDLDYHFAPYFFAKDANPDWAVWPPAAPFPPEAAFLQIGHKYHLRLGVTNPNIGVQYWDEKDNYLPSYSNGWALMNDQNAGIEPGISFDDGWNVFAWGGYDMGWLTPGAGFGVQTATDTWGTWTGAFYYPLTGMGEIISANELYPTDWLTLTLEGDAGMAGGGAFGGGQLIAQFLPNSAVPISLRVDEQQMSDAAVNETGYALDPTAISLGVRNSPNDWLHLALEGKESWARGGGDPYFTGTLQITVKTPGEPVDQFAVHDAVEEAPDSQPAAAP